MTLSDRTKASIKTALAVTIVYAIAMAAGWEKPFWAVFAVVMISQDTAGQSLNKAGLRMSGTLVAATTALTLIALFPQERWAYLLSLSLYFGFCTYKMMGSERPYFWFVSAFVSLIIVVDTTAIDSQDVFQTAVARVQETGMGILVYSIISIFLWPTSSRGALDTASRKLLATQHRLYRAYRGLMTGQGTLGDARPLEIQEAQLLPQLGQAVSAARTESYEVWEVRHQWRSLQQQALTLQQTLERWHETFPQLRQLDPTRFLPNLDAVCEQIDHRLTQVERMLAGDAPEPISHAITVSMDTAQIRTLPYFQQVAVDLARNQLDRLEQVSRSMFDTVRDIKGIGPRSSKPLPAQTGPRGTGFDPDRLQGAMMVMTALWIGFFAWIYVDPPGHALFMFMCTMWTILPLMLKQKPSVLLQGHLFGIGLAGILYVFVMPHLSGYGQLGAMLFASTFAIFYLFWAPSRRGTRTATLATFHVSLGITNEQTYDFAHFANTSASLLLGLAVAVAIPYLFGSPRPEQVFLRLLRHFFRSGEYLMSSMRWDPPRPPTWLDRWKKGFHAREVTTLPGKLLAAAKGIDTRSFPGATTEQIQVLTTRLQGLAYRFQELIEARDNPQAGILVRDLLEDLRAWRLKMQALFQVLSRDPAAKTADELSEGLAETFRHLEGRIGETMNKLAEGEISDQDGEHF